QLSETPPPLASLRPDLPGALTDAVDCCLAKDPAERFHDAGELIAALESAQSFAPDVPMPVRIFTQEVATLGLVVVFATIVSWFISRTMSESADLDVLIPIVLVLSIVLGRVMQTFV